jgi:hypothetical protein
VSSEFRVCIEEFTTHCHGEVSQGRRQSPGVAAANLERTVLIVGVCFIAQLPAMTWGKQVSCFQVLSDMTVPKSGNSSRWALIICA